MRKLSSIQEGMWRSVVARSDGNEIRNEDRNNIDKIKPVNLSGDIPVYIANIDYEEAGKDHFTWDEVMEINKKNKKYRMETPSWIF